MKKSQLFIIKFFIIASMCNFINASQHNLYIGIQSGINAFTGKQQSQATNDLPTTIKLINNKSIKANGIAGGLYAGYVVRYCDFGLGTEILWQYTNLEKTLNAHFRDIINADDLQFSLKTNLRSRSEIVLKPGYFINNYFTYAIFGLAFQKVDFRYSAIGKQAAAANPVQTNSAKKSKIVRGSTIGVGVQKNIYEHIDMGIEFKYTKLSGRNYNLAVPGSSQISLSSTLKNINTYSYCLRFMYKF